MKNLQITLPAPSATATNVKNAENATNNVGQYIVAVLCLTFFPLMYLIGSFLMG